MESVTLICDGSCEGNPGRGGWAAIMKSGDRELVLTGCHPATTNNRMELTAALQALKALKRPCAVELQTDSMYLKQGITEWLPIWTINGWMTSCGKPVLNQDLWQQLAELAQQHEVHWRWTPGHTTGNEDQNRVDRLAYRAARQQ
jgi:ribonuclease HI